jgi:hypothetical protein
MAVRQMSLVMWFAPDLMRATLRLESLTIAALN